MRLLPIAFLTLAGIVNATPVTWYLHDVHFGQLGGTPGYAFGSFTYNADTMLLTNWSITTPMWGTALPFTYTPLHETQVVTSGSAIEIWEDDVSYILRLRFDSPLTNSGITTRITPDLFGMLSGPEASLEFVHGQFGGSGVRYIDSGFVSTQGPSTTPEPFSIALVGAGVALCLYRKRRTL